MKSRRTKLAGHIARMGKRRGSYGVLVGRSKERKMVEFQHRVLLKNTVTGNFVKECSGSAVCKFWAPAGLLLLNPNFWRKSYRVKRVLVGRKERSKGFIKSVFK